MKQIRVLINIQEENIDSSKIELLLYKSISEKNLLPKIEIGGNHDINNFDIVIFIANDLTALNLDEIDEDKMVYLFCRDRYIDIDEVDEKIIENSEIKKRFCKKHFCQNFSDIESIVETLEQKLSSDISKVLNPITKETYIDSIDIRNYYSIEKIELQELKDKREIYFVGENGDGKTIILQALALALKGNENIVIVNNYTHKLFSEREDISLIVKDEKYEYDYFGNRKVINLFAYGINRNKIRDKDEDESGGYSGLFDTHSHSNTTYLKDPEKVLLSKSPIIEELKKKLTNLLDGFEIKTNNEKVLFSEDIEFSKLSEGYKTTIIWICDLVARLMKNSPNVKELSEFKAIVLIDEVDLYLHPKWKYNFMFKLREIFPNIQFFITTHSLVTILGASTDAVFYKVYKEESKTKVSSEIGNISKFTSNVLMTSPLIGLEKMEARGYENYEELNSDDYIFHRIHQKIAERLKDKPFVTDEEVDEWIGEELDDELAELND